MFDTVLSYLEELIVIVPNYLPSALQLLTVLAWIFVIKKFGYRYEVSLKICLGLIFASLLVTTFTLRFVAGILAEYAFIFLSIGIIQKVFQKF